MPGALLLAVGLFLLPQAPISADAPDLNGRLYKSVFAPGAGALTDADLKELPPSMRDRLARYLKRRSAFASQLKGGSESMKAMAVEAKKRRLEAGIVSLIEAADIERHAAAYALDATVRHEWEEGAPGPLMEAEYAEDYLKQNPSTPLAPYLYVFIAHRQRAAFETMNAALHKNEMTMAAKKYRTFMQRARAAADPIFHWLAEDLDRQAFVFVKSEHHPRDFNPDT